MVYDTVSPLGNRRERDERRGQCSGPEWSGKERKGVERKGTQRAGFSLARRRNWFIMRHGSKVTITPLPQKVFQQLGKLAVGCHEGGAQWSSRFPLSTTTHHY
jgi:hypothetical protein